MNINEYTNVFESAMSTKYIDVSNMAVGMADASEALLDSFKTVETISGDGYMFGPALKTASDVVSLTSEEAVKCVPKLIERSLESCKDIAQINRNLIRLDTAVQKVNSKAGLAIGIGLVACTAIGYLWWKHKNNENRISRLENAIMHI